MMRSAFQFSRQFPSLSRQFYVWGKVATDPLYAAVHELLAPSTEPLLDLGCGMGVLAFYLRECGWSGNLLGVDVDGEKIALANQLAARYPGKLCFQHTDVTVDFPDHCGSITVLDVLQYFTPGLRCSLLQACAQRLSANGLLVIRSGIRGSHWRAKVTHWLDRIATRTGWIATRSEAHPTLEELTAILTNAGLIGSFKPLWGRTPFHNWLGVFRRPPALAEG